MDWHGVRVLVPGGRGFLGRHLVALLHRAGAIVTVPPRDLRELATARAACEGQEVVIDLAAVSGGVQFQESHGFDILRDNLLMAGQLLEAARLGGVGRVVLCSSATVYAPDAPVPTPEDAPLAPPGAYGFAKVVVERMAREVRSQHGLRTAVARLANMYGPGDHEDPARSTAIASLLRRAREGEDPLVVWGDGTATRSFLYVEDAARGLLALAEHMPEAPVNLGSPEETSIRELATLVGELARTRVEFDPTRPAGRPRSCLDVARARELLGWTARVSLPEGLRRTWEAASVRPGPAPC